MKLITITTCSIKLRNTLLAIAINLEIERDKSLLIIEMLSFEFCANLEHKKTLFSIEWKMF